MPKITASFAELKFDVRAAERALDKQCKDILIEGTREWVRTVAAIVPNWSGMSRASLKPIADLVDVPLFASNVAGAPNRVARGESLGEAKLETRNFRYFFFWRSRVFHFVYNESNNANAIGFRLRNPGPYHSMRQAQQSFFRTVNPALRDLQFAIGPHIRVIRKVVRG